MPAVSKFQNYILGQPTTRRLGRGQEAREVEDDESQGKKETNWIN
jgi:hypothetical protein